MSYKSPVNVSDESRENDVQWQYYRTVFGRPLPQSSLDAWGWDKPEGWWAAEDEEEAKASAQTEGDGRYRSRVIHHTYDEWEESSVEA